MPGRTRSEQLGAVTPPRPRGNLPQQPSTFVGREQELADVRHLLATAPVLTLTGSGGVGKTRLALELGARGIDQYPEGVWVVELASVMDPALVPQAVISALGLREQPGQAPLTLLVGQLGPRHLLLVLDHCEHLVEACAQLAHALVGLCSDLRILATSRERLGVPGELAWRVPSLPVPDPHELSSTPELAQYAGVRLFVERARAVQPGFAISDQNAAAVAEVCWRLDGIPLALELAAARARVLSAQQIARRLDDRFGLLTGGSRTALPRQQTLRATIDWSYGLLGEPERALLNRLCVFVGGWTLEAAEAVCAGAGIEAADVLDLLTSLVEESLVIAEEHAGTVRYRLLETVREYARQTLRKTSEEDEPRERHCAWYVALAERAEPEFKGPQQAAWRAGLGREHDNLRAALAWTLERRDVEAGPRLAGALWAFWLRSGQLVEGRRWLEQQLTLAGDERAHPHFR